MDADRFQLDIVTPERQVFSGEVAQVVAPGAEGLFEVLRGHVDYVVELRPGPLTFTYEGDRHRYVVGGGFAQVSSARVIVLADLCEDASEVDPARARKEMDAAEKVMLENGASTREYLDARATQLLSIARLQAAEGGAKGEG